MASSSKSAFAFLPQGALIQEFIVAGHNIVLGFPRGDPYQDAPFLGETIGRVANRLKDAEITSLNGRSYKLAANNGKNHLHGGVKGWGKKTFSGPHPQERNGKESVQFTYLSPDGDEGYPGTVELRVWYTGFEEQEEGVTKVVLVAEYEVEFVGDECDETAVNVTNHSYFNIGDGPTIEGTECTITTTKYQVVDDGAIPTGAIEDYPGLEANKPFVLGTREPAIDHCFILDTDPANVPVDTRPRDARKLISFSHPRTKLHLDIYSTEPAFQFYTGEFLNVPATADTPARPRRAGLCVEPSRYINAINVPDWRDTVLLRRGQTWGSKTIYKAWKA